jgi:hypothetical protein
MRTFVAVACLSGALLCAGCEEDAVKSTDVVELQVCAGEEADLDKGCRDELTADGFSTALVRACLVVTDERRADLKAILTASAGRFSEPKDPEAPRIAELSFGAERCASTQLVAPLTPGHLQVQATVEGYVTAPEKLTVIPAGVDTVDLEPATFELEAKKSSTILVEVHASGLVGSLSQGTRVEVELQPTPSTAAVQVTPSKVVLDEKECFPCSRHLVSLRSRLPGRLGHRYSLGRRRTRPQGASPSCALKKWMAMAVNPENSGVSEVSCRRRPEPRTAGTMVTISNWGAGIDRPVKLAYASY